MYIGANGELTGASLIGPKASGVPGAVAGMLEAHRRYGRLPISKVLAPAVRLASQGFVVDSIFARSITAAKYRIENYSCRAAFFANDSAPAVVSRFAHPALDRSIRF